MKMDDKFELRITAEALRTEKVKIVVYDLKDDKKYNAVFNGFKLSCLGDEIEVYIERD